MSNAAGVRIRMILGAQGEDGEILTRGEGYEVSRRFARQLIHSGKAEVWTASMDDAAEKAAAAEVKAAQKAAAAAAKAEKAAEKAAAKVAAEKAKAEKAAAKKAAAEAKGK